MALSMRSLTLDFMQNSLFYTLDGRHLTEQFEGLRLTAYPDSTGIPTIAYGHTAGVKLGDTCTEEQADAWLQEDIQWAATVVNHLVTFQLTQDEFNAVTDFTFNVGSGNFASSTLLKLLNAGDMANAALEFDKWDHAGGQVVAGLLRRREAETQEFAA
jgi:lysozyme